MSNSERRSHYLIWNISEEDIQSTKQINSDTSDYFDLLSALPRTARKDGYPAFLSRLRTNYIKGFDSSRHSITESLCALILLVG